MNALNSLLFSELKEALDAILKNNEAKVVIIAGHEKFFAIGADFKEITNVTTPVYARRFFRQSQLVFSMIADFEMPVIAAVSGLALGEGCEIASSCDLRIAA
jgi:enoyl-CoA hydratase/carnithine racemase